MAEPLDYRNPEARDEPQPAMPVERVCAAIPFEFDLMLTRTTDHAAVGAIEAALGRVKIAFFRTEDAISRQAELHIHAADRERASLIASQIFAHRRKIKSMPRTQMPPGMGTMSGGSERFFMP